MSFSCQLLAETAKLFVSLFHSLTFLGRSLTLWTHAPGCCPHQIKLCGADVTGAVECEECGGSERERESERVCLQEQNSNQCSGLSAVEDHFRLQKKKEKRIVTLHFNALYCNFISPRILDIKIFIMCILYLANYICNFISQFSTPRQKWAFMGNSTLHTIKQTLY